MKHYSSYYKGKSIWITGASSGIGKQVAITLSKLKSSVILSSRRESVLEEIQKSLSEGSESEVVPLDMLDPTSIDLAIKQVTRNKEIDILFLNAGISQRATALDTSNETAQRIMDTNYHGLVRLAKGVLPQMLARGSGHIVVMSSVTGKIGVPNRSSYAASKHALHGYFDSLRAEIERHGVFITVICPGYIYTEISSNALTADGSPQGNIDLKSKNGMPVEKFVVKALRGVAAKKSELLIGGKEIFAVYLKRFFPSILRKVVKNIKA